MPTYEYRCKACGDHLEVVQSFTDDPLTVHEGCGGDLRKVFGSVGIAFKGSGFYKTDSRAKAASGTSSGGSSSEKSSSDGGPSGDSSSSSSDSGSSASSDSKSATPSTPSPASTSTST